MKNPNIFVWVFSMTMLVGAILPANVSAMDSCSAIASGQNPQGTQKSAATLVPLTKEEQSLLADIERNVVLNSRELHPYFLGAKVHPIILLRALFSVTQYPHYYSANSIEAIIRLAERTTETLDQMNFQRLKRTAVSDRLKQELSLVLNRSNPLIPLKIWIRFLKLYRSFAPAEEIDMLIVGLATVFQEKMGREPGFSHLSQYLKFKLVKESIKKGLGLPYESITDLAIHWNERQLSVSSFSVDRIKGRPENKFGFFHKDVETFAPPRGPIEKVYEVFGAEKTEKFHVKIEPIGKLALAPLRKPAPDYSAMVSDGVLGGAILIANNLTDFTAELRNQYRDYLVAEGFRRTEDRNLTAAQATGIFLSKVTSMELDYVLREGHSESSTGVLANLGQNVRVEKFERQRQRGKAREVMWVFTGRPGSKGDSSDTITQSGLGQALRSRNQPTQQFLYIDTSCFASDDFCTSMNAVAAVGFTPIGSDIQVETFSEEAGGPVYEILHGVRNLKTYSEIKTSIRKAELEEDEDEAGFVFPNSPKYLKDRKKHAVDKKQLRFNISIFRQKR